MDIGTSSNRTRSDSKSPVEDPDNLRPANSNRGDRSSKQIGQISDGEVEIGHETSYRYLGPHGPDYLVPTLTERRWLLFIKPVTIKTWQWADWARKYKHDSWFVS